MTTSISGISASVNSIQSTLPPTSNVPFFGSRTVGQIEDQVQLSDAAQQFVAANSSADSASSAAYTPDLQELVRDLVRAAAAGDAGALSWLTIA